MSDSDVHALRMDLQEWLDSAPLVRGQPVQHAEMRVTHSRGLALVAHLTSGVKCLRAVGLVIQEYIHGVQQQLAQGRFHEGIPALEIPEDLPPEEAFFFADDLSQINLVLDGSITDPDWVLSNELERVAQAD